MITGPKNARPTLNGWVSPKGELLKSQRISQIQIDEWNGVGVFSSSPVMLTEAPVGNKSLDDMAKPDLIALEQQYDVYLGNYPQKPIVKTKLQEFVDDDKPITFLLD